jgi:hypothetical protein
VIGEVQPNGRYAYPVVVIEEPRQCGKTTGILDLLLGRAAVYRDYRCAYTAQTGHVVSERFTEWIDSFEDHPVLGPRMKLRRSGGTERITLRSTHSFVKAFPPKDGALRGPAIDAVFVDEAQQHDDVLGAALDRTAIPTMSTRPRRQLFIVGTAGTDASTYFARHIAAAQAGTPGYAYFSYGVPAGVDPNDEDLWSTWHPGLIAGITDTDALRMARDTLGEAGFAREYGTVWSRTQAHVIDPEAWARVQSTTDMPEGPLCLGVDVAADRRSGAIALAGIGRHLEIVEVRDGTEWIVRRVLELQASTGAPIAIDGYGPVGTVTDELKRAGARLMVTTTQDVGNAAATFLDAVNAATAPPPDPDSDEPPVVPLKVWPHPALDDAVAAATKRGLGDAGFAWSRKTSAASIAPLVAACAALWGVERLPAPPPRPVAVI